MAEARGAKRSNNVNDHNLFLAISEFLRDCRLLKTLMLSVPSANWAQKRLG